MSDFKVGDRVRRTDFENGTVPPGTLGTVSLLSIRGADVKWDSGEGFSYASNSKALEPAVTENAVVAAVEAYVKEGRTNRSCANEFLNTLGLKLPEKETFRVTLKVELDRDEKYSPARIRKLMSEILAVSDFPIEVLEVWRES